MKVFHLQYIENNKNINMKQTLYIEMADDVLLGMDKSPKELAEEMRVAAAVKWYEMGTISQERAAQLAGMNRAAFIDALSRFNVSPFQETAEEIMDALDENDS